MIKNFEIIVDSLYDIINNKTKLYTVLGKKIPGVVASKEDRKTIGIILGSSIRHFLFFKGIFAKFHKDDKSNLVYAVAIGYSDIYFTHKLGSEDQVKETLLEYSKTIDKNEEMTSIIEYLKNKKPFDVLDQDFKNESITNYFSMRFNVPTWLLRMWTKQYGKGEAIRIVKSLTMKAPRYIKRNDVLASSKFQLDEKKYRLVKDDVYEYIGKDNFKNLEDNVLGRVYTTNILEHTLISSLDPTFAESIIYYYYDKPNLYLDIINKYKNGNTISLLTDTFKNSIKLIEHVKKIKATTAAKLYVGETTPEVAEAHVSKNSLLFILYAKSSNFNYIAGSPEYILNFDTNELDEIIKNERKDLEDSSKFIALGGSLIYITQTINKKENENLVKEFIENHPEFVVEDEKLFLPFDEGHMLGYYAILSRIK